MHLKKGITCLFNHTRYVICCIDTTI